MTSAVSVRNLVKTYPGRPPVEAVRGVDLTIERGECFGVLGPNGAGKTTTIEVLEGLLPPTSGDVHVLGRQWGVDDQDIRQRIGISLQETRLSEKLSVLETLTLFRSFYRRGKTPAEAIRQVGLEEKTNAWVKTLSGGQQQRLAVACGLIGDPEMLFLDEPTTGLDPQSRRQLWEIVSSFRDEGRSVLLTTHYMEEAERLCDRVAIIDRGQIIAIGTPEELIAGIGGHHVVEFSLEGDGESEAFNAESWAELPSVVDSVHDARGFRLSVTEPHRVVSILIGMLHDQGHGLSDLAIRHASLDDVFVKLAGRHLEGDDTEAP